MARGLISQQSLIDTANAIRFSAENSTKMLPSEMPDNIRSIEGKVIALPKGRVNFYDYDGELLYSYSPKEFIEKGLPDNPRHEGLVAQGWNWSYEEITTQIKEVGGDINIGQMYITQSGATQIDINIEENNFQLYLCFKYPSDAQYIIDWGDNSELIEETKDSSGTFNEQHVYSQPGNYTIKIKIIQGYLYLYNNHLIWDNDNTKIIDSCKDTVINIKMGENVWIDDDSSLSNYYFLQSCLIPKNLKYDVFISYSFFQNCYSLKTVIIPNVLNGSFFLINDFNNCYALQHLILPYHCSDESMGQYPMIINCYNLKSITIPSDLTSINSQGQGNFKFCYSLIKINIPSTKIRIPNNCFEDCYNILEYHFKSTTPPTLGTNVFTGINQNCKIYVPYSTDHSVLNAYKTATNWSTWADYIVEEDAPIEYAMPTPIADRPELLVDVEEAEDGDEVNYSININIINEEDE